MAEKLAPVALAVGHSVGAQRPVASAAAWEDLGWGPSQVTQRHSVRAFGPAGVRDLVVVSGSAETNAVGEV